MTDGELPTLLAMTFRVFMDRVHDQLAEEGYAGLRPAHGFTFQFLSTHPAPTGVDLAAHLGVTKQAAGQLLDELVRRGYVEARPHPTDKRSRIAVLTERGWACINRVQAIATAEEHRWAAEIGSQRFAELRADLHSYLRITATGRPALRPVW